MMIMTISMLSLLQGPCYSLKEWSCASTTWPRQGGDKEKSEFKHIESPEHHYLESLCSYGVCFSKFTVDQLLDAISLLKYLLGPRCDMEEKKDEADSSFNEGEARVAIAHTRRLIDGGVKPSDIGIITPYSAQVYPFEELELEISFDEILSIRVELPQFGKLVTKMC